MKKTLILFFLGLTTFFACNRPEIIFQEEKIFANNIWQTDSVCEFECSISDTTHPYNIFMILSNTKLYSYQNLYMFVTINFPRGVVRVDTIDCFLADGKGKWYGKQKNDSYKQKLMYRRKIRFPYAGTYKFQIEQAMRKNHLEGIHAIGITVETPKK
ncbi:MAG: gliding motility lipoprotein GldH [Bacteroidales bacterium]|nr:gliding motility lipoprotein GldH [Bacteroidales bacterium]